MGAGERTAIRLLQKNAEAMKTYRFDIYVRGRYKATLVTKAPPPLGVLRG